MAQRTGKSGNSDRFCFLGLQSNSLQTVTMAMKLKTLAPWKKSYDKPRQHIRQHINLDSRDITLPTKVHTVKAMVFPVNYDWM